MQASLSVESDAPSLSERERALAGREYRRADPLENSGSSSFPLYPSKDKGGASLLTHIPSLLIFFIIINNNKKK